MKSIYLFDSYKEFTVRQLKARRRGGYGQMRRLADHLRVHSTLVSQVLNGQKEFTLEQAASVAFFLSLSAVESEYFLLLVQMARAGNPELRTILRRQHGRARDQGKNLSSRVPKQTHIPEERRATFYADWTYSAVRQILSIPGEWSIEKISERLNIELGKTRDVIQFLLETSLIVLEEGTYKIGPLTTHLDASSPWARSHHMNWRHKSVERMSQRKENDFFFSCPMTLSRADAEVVHELMLESVQKTFSKADPSPSEELYCLNIDWFQV